jgi:hypothetical protein
LPEAGRCLGKIQFTPRAPLRGCRSILDTCVFLSAVGNLGMGPEKSNACFKSCSAPLESAVDPVTEFHLPSGWWHIECDLLWLADPFQTLHLVSQSSDLIMPPNTDKPGTKGGLERITW